jgi:AcrR family transcriptional regulator
MNRDMDDRRSSERLERLIEEAEALITQEGFLHLSTDDLAQRLHCSKRALYEIAPGREKFFEAIIERRIARIERQNISALESASNVESSIMVCIDFMVNTLENLSSVYIRDLMRFPPGERAVKRCMQGITAALTRVIERGERENVLRRFDARVVAEALSAAVVRMIQPDFLANSRVTSADAVRQVHQIFWHGVCRDGDTGPAAKKGRAPRSRVRRSARRDIVSS